MRFVIISDIHLGTAHSRIDLLGDFLSLLPPDVSLILNGDTFEAPGRLLPVAHERVFARLRGAAESRPVWLIPGNHDADLSGIDCGAMQVVERYRIGDRLLVLHGHQLDLVMPAHRRFIRLFRLFHGLRVRLGAADVHVAQYAKRWRRLYTVLVDSQRQSALELAARENVAAIACGHVHQVEDSVVQGIRYLNTGAWTEEPICCIAGDEHELHICPIAAVVGQGRWLQFPRGVAEAGARQRDQGALRTSSPAGGTLP